MNELIRPSNLDHNAIDFEAVSKLNFVEILKEEIKEAQKKISIYEENSQDDFDSVLGEMFSLSEKIDRLSTIFYSLYELDLTDERMAIAPEISNLLTNFYSEVNLNPKVFKRLKNCYESRNDHNYSVEQIKIIESQYEELIRNGALLNDDDKEKLKKIDLKLNELRLKFNENTLKGTNADFLWVQDKKDLLGLPDDLIEGALSAAKEQTKEGWIFTLHAPSYSPFMTYAKNRSLREEFYRKRAKIALGGEFDNQATIKEILQLRFDRAGLLGFKNHAEFVLEKRMAGKPDKVYGLLEQLKSSSYKAAENEINALKSLMQKDLGSDDIQAWDVSYYSEKYKMETLNFDDEELKPYFKLENVVAGAFEVANKMYGLKFKERADLPIYHPEVKTFEVYDGNTNSFIGLLYTDYFPRKTKGSGAWCDQFQAQGHMFGEVRRPHVLNVGNFNPSTESKPSLLNFNEVLTLFHEFGHGLHTLLSQCEHRALSGTSVLWDFVELPSQIMENWCYEKECLDLFAKHFETEELIPADLVSKLSEMAKFMRGSRILRQVKLALLDMKYHDQNPEKIGVIEDFEKSTFKDLDLTPSVAGTCMSTNFGHLFGGGYSAGYYSYHWAEVLDADAFEYFKAEGIFNTEIAGKFRTEILEKGGTADPSTLYRNFRSKDATPEALLRRSGLN